MWGDQRHARDDEGGLTRDQIHHLLSNRRRRLVISALVDAEEPLDLRDLSERIAGDEAGERPPPRDVRHTVYVSLQQTHLPKLDGLDVVEYDDQSKAVTLGAAVSDVEPYMDTDDGGRRGGCSFVLGVGSLVALSAGVALGVPPTVLVAGAYVALLLFALAGAYFLLTSGGAALPSRPG
ncbi:MAG: ArsR family transcriptional regulator [Halobacteriaceae archaeon]